MDRQQAYRNYERAVTRLEKRLLADKDTAWDTLQAALLELDKAEQAGGQHGSMADDKG